MAHTLHLLRSTACLALVLAAVATAQGTALPTTQDPATQDLATLDSATQDLATLDSANQDPAALDPFVRDVRPLLQRHCFGCHGDRKTEGGVKLSVARTAADLIGAYRLWRRVARVVAQDEMPPPKRRRRPTAAERAAIASGVRAVLARGAARHDPGRPVLRRLNRGQYERTLRDLLLGLPFDAARLFPKDPQAYGFDTVGDVLFTSPLLIEKYLDVTQRALDELDRHPQLLQRLIPVRPANPADAAGPTVAAAAEQVLRPFLRRAFRRPPTADEVRRRVAVVTAEVGRGQAFPAAVRTAFQTVLLSPHFLFRVEADRPSAEPWPVDDHELAVRLSYFLWSTMPDDRLAGLADQGRLRDDAVLRAEVRRMLDDPRSRALADDFAAQWLGFRSVRDHAMDVRRFGVFHRLRQDLYEESARFFDDLVRRDQPITRVLDADYSFLNARLAGHYGIPGVRGDQFRRVTLPDRRRGGILGMASVLATTSYPLRTSPVLRGKWVLESLLDEPPPPPPPDAGALPADDQQRDRLTLRQRLEQHRKDARCAACHARMDPLGFALERYDAIGRWRESNHGQPIDAKASLPDGTELDGPIALKDWLLGRQDAFVRTAARRLLTYAVGRDLELPDEKVVDGIVAAARRAGDSTRTLIEAVAMSYPFRHRRKAR